MAVIARAVVNRLRPSADSSGDSDQDRKAEAFSCTHRSSGVADLPVTR
jgi:hypothetical protein